MNLLSEYLGYLHEEDEKKKSTWKDKLKKYGKYAVGAAAVGAAAYGGYALKKYKDKEDARIIAKFSDREKATMKQQAIARKEKVAKKKKDQRDYHKKLMDKTADKRDKLRARQLIKKQIENEKE